MKRFPVGKSAGKIRLKRNFQLPQPRTAAKKRKREEEKEQKYNKTRNVRRLPLLSPCVRFDSFNLVGSFTQRDQSRHWAGLAPCVRSLIFFPQRRGHFVRSVLASGSRRAAADFSRSFFCFASVGRNGFSPSVVVVGTVRACEIPGIDGKASHVERECDLRSVWWWKKV